MGLDRQLPFRAAPGSGDHVRLVLSLLLCVGALTSRSAWAASPQVAALRRQVSAKHQEAIKVIQEMSAVAAEKKAAVAEMRAGQFCSGCGRTRTEILRTESTFPHPGQHIVPGTPEQIAAKEKEFDDKLKALADRLQQLQRSAREVDMQASKLEFEENQARFRAQQEEAKQRLAKQRAESDARLAKMKEEMGENQRKIREAFEKGDKERQAKAEADRAAMEESRKKIEQDRRASQAAYSASIAAIAAQARPTPSDALKRMNADLQGAADLAGPSAGPSPAQVARQAKLQELVNAGLASAPQSFDLDGVNVTAPDRNTSVADAVLDLLPSSQSVLDGFNELITKDLPAFKDEIGRSVERRFDDAVDAVKSDLTDRVATGIDRVNDVRKSAKALGSSFDQVVAGTGGPDPVTRAKAIGENASDTYKLSDTVLDALPDAADAMAKGDYERAEAISGRLDSAAERFEKRADLRAQKVSPEYRAVRQAETLREKVDNLESPYVPPANDKERLELYKRAGKGAFDIAMDLKPKAEAPVKPPVEAKRWGPATGAGPLGEKIAGTFRSSSYTEFRAAEPIVLYRVYSDDGKQFGSYWTRTSPYGPTQALLDGAVRPEWGNKGTKVVRIEVPAGTTIFEGVAGEQGQMVGGGNQIFLQDIDPSWVRE